MWHRLPANRRGAGTRKRRPTSCSLRNSSLPDRHDSRCSSRIHSQIRVVGRRSSNVAGHRIGLCAQGMPAAVLLLIGLTMLGGRAFVAAGVLSDNFGQADRVYGFVSLVGSNVKATAETGE